MRTKSRPENWLFAGLKPKSQRLEAVPLRLDDEQRRVWAEQQQKRDLEVAYDAISARLHPGVVLSAALKDGELSFAIDDITVIDRVFVSKEEGEFILAQWKLLAATMSITESTDGKKLAGALRKLAVYDNPAAAQQVIELEKELSAAEDDIRQKEGAINKLADKLYELKADDIKLVSQS